MSFEERIRTTLKETGAAIAVDELRLAPIRPPVRQTRSGRSRAVAFAAGFLVVALFGVGAVLLSPSDPSPVLTGTDGRISVSDEGPLVWREIELLPANSVGEELAHGPAGWLMMTPRTDRLDRWADAVVLQSGDGVEWSPFATDGFESVVHVDGLVGQPDRYLAFGLYGSPSFTATTVGRPSNFPEPAVWTSEDGVAWQLTALPLPNPDQAISDVVSYRIFDVAIADGVTVAVGVEFDEIVPEGIPEDAPAQYSVPTRQILWRTNQEGTWELVDDERFDSAMRLAAGPAGIITTTAEGEDASVVWHTTDGAQWDQIGVVEGQPNSIVGNDQGYLARIRDRIWFSPDGIEWTPVPDLDGIVVSGAGPGGFVAATDGPVGVWWSPDGHRWRNVATSENIGSTIQYPGAAAADSTAVIITGQDQNGRGRTVVGTTR